MASHCITQLHKPHPPAVMDEAELLRRLIEVGGAKGPAFVQERVRREVVENRHKELEALQGTRGTDSQTINTRGTSDAWTSTHQQCSHRPCYHYKRNFYSSTISYAIDLPSKERFQPVLTLKAGIATYVPLSAT